WRAAPRSTPNEGEGHPAPQSQMRPVPETGGGSLEATAADERRRVPARDARDLDHVTGVRRVDEAAAADVDPDMAEPVEEDEVAWLEAAQRNRAAVAVLGVRAVRKRDPDLREDVHHKAGAVEPGRRGAAPDVRRAEVAHRDPDDAAVARRGRGTGRGRG